VSVSAIPSASARAGGGESLKDAVQQTLDEARMVQPGIQALFGFQLIAVFNERFARVLSEREQSMHLAAIVLVTIAIALVMTPAAYHRQVEPRRATAGFLVLASRLVSGAMLPLAVGLAIDVYLIARVITDAPRLSAALGVAVLAMFVVLCVGVPQWRAMQARRAAPR